MLTSPFNTKVLSFRSIIKILCSTSIVASVPFFPPPSHCLSLPSCESEGPSRDGTIGEDTIRASLISAVSDKLRWRMKEEMDKAQAELDALKRTEEDLKKGHQKLEEMVLRLDQEVVGRLGCFRGHFIVSCYSFCNVVLVKTV